MLDPGVLNLFRDIFPAARCVLLICFLSTTNTPQLAAGIFYFRDKCLNRAQPLSTQSGASSCAGREAAAPRSAFPIRIDRAPVLTLWATVVAERLGLASPQIAQSISSMRMTWVMF